MEQVAKFRPFRIPQIVESQFFTPDNSINEDFMVEDLDRSGLDATDIDAYPAASGVRLMDNAEAAYTIPYFNLDGKPIVDREGYPAMWRLRMKFPEFHRGQRYTQPSREQLAKLGLPPHLPYIRPETLSLEGEDLICAEGEKKAASIMRHLGIPAFGIGGCWMWKNPDGSGTLHPWIRELLSRRSSNSLVIIPDGDVFRYDICNAYGTFARTAQQAGISVRILNTGGKIDDLIVEWGEEAADRFAALEYLDLDSLVQSPSSLIEKYGLAFRRDSKDRAVVYQHTANVERLLEQHPAFPKLWRNLDNNRVMLGEEPAQPDLTEMDLANYFQYNLGFDKVTHRLVYSVIQAIAKRNAKSPMLEWVRSQEWDGVERLDTWMSQFWGVEDTQFNREVAAKFLLSACARMDKPGCKVDWMLIVVGPQATGKTSMPGVLFRGANLTLYGEHNDKDLHMLLHSALVVGFDELDSFGKRESSNLKAMITRTEDAFRPPYGASVEVFPRRFTLYGCGNRYEFLQHDPSGYRRYAIVEVNKLLDFRGLEANMEQLWAEAYARYSGGGERWWEVSGASQASERFVVANPMEEMVLSWIYSQFRNKSATNVRDGVLHFTMTQLLGAIGMERDVRNTNVTRELAAILRGLGAEQQNTRKEVVPGVFGRHYQIRS
jgi:hypothetical protein